MGSHKFDLGLFVTINGQTSLTHRAGGSLIIGVILFQGKEIDRLVNKVSVRVLASSAVMLKLSRSASFLAACR